MGTPREGERVELIRQSGGQLRGLVVRGRLKTTVGRRRRRVPASRSAPGLMRRRAPAGAARGKWWRRLCAHPRLTFWGRLRHPKRRESALRRQPQHVAASGESLGAEAAHPPAAEQGEGPRAPFPPVAPSVQPCVPCPGRLWHLFAGDSSKGCETQSVGSAKFRV